MVLDSRWANHRQSNILYCKYIMRTLINSKTAVQTIQAYSYNTRNNRKFQSNLLHGFRATFVDVNLNLNSFLVFFSPCLEYYSMDKQAGVLLLGTAGVIPPMTLEHMETHCEIAENKKLIPFAFRVHTHSLGKVVSGYRIRDGQWKALGKHDPQKPQMFYPINSSEPIQQGDILAARCTMLSNRRRPTYIGYVYFCHSSFISEGPAKIIISLISHTHTAVPMRMRCATFI